MGLKDGLRAVRVFNEHDLLKRFGSHDDVEMSYSEGHVSFYSPRFKTERNAPFYQNGCRWLFPDSHQGTAVEIRRRLIEKAKVYAAENYHVDEWAPSPFSRFSWVPLRVRRAAEEFVKGA